MPDGAAARMRMPAARGAPVPPFLPRLCNGGMPRVERGRRPTEPVAHAPADGGFRVTLVAPDGVRAEFRAPRGRSIVLAAQRAGYLLTSGCRQGRCAICRGRLRAGTVAALRRPSPNARTDPAARRDGCVLLCSVGPLDDLEIEVLSPWTVR